MKLKLKLLFLFLSVISNTTWSCHSLSPQYTQYGSRRARARGTNILENENANAIDFDYLTSNLPFSANDIRSMSSMFPFPVKPSLSVQEGGKLTCFFDDEMEYCGWHNSENMNELKLFWRGKIEKSGGDSQLLQNTLENFSGEKFFLMAGGEPSTLTTLNAALEVEIPCQYGDAEVKFDFWANKPTIIVRYCITKYGDFECQVVPRTVNPMNFSVPTTADELKLRLEFLNFDADSIVLIDNLHYNGQICELVDEVTEHESTLASLEPIDAPTTPPQSPELLTVPSVAPEVVDQKEKVQKFFEDENLNTVTDDGQFKELSPCAALTCNFNDGDSCFYGLTGPGSTSSWSLSDRLVGNRHTGIQRVNLADQKKVGFIYVGDDFSAVGKSTIFVAESPKFSLDSNVVLLFDVYIRSIFPKLKVCLDDFDTCPYTSKPPDLQIFWHESQKIELTKSVKKVFFVVENVRKHQFLAIDNIRLETENGSSYC